MNAPNHFLTLSHRVYHIFFYSFRLSVHRESFLRAATSVPFLFHSWSRSVSCHWRETCAIDMNSPLLLLFLLLYLALRANDQVRRFINIHLHYILLQYNTPSLSPTGNAFGSNKNTAKIRHHTNAGLLNMSQSWGGKGGGGVLPKSHASLRVLCVSHTCTQRSRSVSHTCTRNK